MGKNYLLETYLNGLHDVDGKNESNNSNSNNNNNINNDKEITTPGNSDSGVNTEDIATSPDVGLSSPITNASSTSSSDNNNNTNSNNNNAKNDGKTAEASTLKDICKRLSLKDKSVKKQSIRKSNEVATTSREAKLRMEHESRKEFCDKMEKMNEANADNENVNNKMQASRKDLNVNDHLAGQIELLEKVIAINKHIQHEEELLVRLNAKIRKYEVDDPNLSETEMKKVLERINTNIEASTSELVKTEQELTTSNQMLITKSQIAKELSKELKALELRETNENQNVIQVPSHQIQIHSTSCDTTDGQFNEQRIEHQIDVQSIEIASPTTSSQTPIPAPKPIKKTGTLPKLISSVLKKATPINAKNTHSGTIPKTQQQQQQRPSESNQTPLSENINRTTVTAIPSTALYVAKNQSFIVPDHVILSQAPLFFQKDNFNGDFMQSTDQRNINTTNYNTSSHNISNFNSSNSNNININNVNINPSMVNCGKIGPKKLINGFYKDPDSDTGLSSLNEDVFQHVGTLV